MDLKEYVKNHQDDESYEWNRVSRFRVENLEITRIEMRRN